MKKDEYIKPTKAWSILSKAQHTRQPVYICAMAGMGKTLLVQNFFGEHKFFYISARDDFSLESLPKERNDRTISVVIDNLESLKDQEERKKLLSLQKRDDIWFIFVSRSPLYTWLAPIYYSTGILLIKEEELSLSLEDTRDYFASKGVTFSENDIAYLRESTGSMAQALHLASSRYLLGERDMHAIVQEFLDISFVYIQQKILPGYDEDVQDFLLKISVMDSFDKEMAEELTGTVFFEALMQKIYEMGNFLVKNKEIYSMKRPALLFFRSLSEQRYGSAVMKQLAVKAAEIYKKRGQLVTATLLYKRAGEHDLMLSTLAENILHNKGKSYASKLKDIFLSLTDEEMEKFPLLMATRSLIYALFMQTDKSEKLYLRLRKMSEDESKGEDFMLTARASAVWLDLILPQRSVQQMDENMLMVRHFPPELRKRLPEFSLTGTQPSVLNGTKDFWKSSCSKKLEEIASIEEHFFEKNEYRIAAIAISNGERLYEQNADIPETMAALAQGQMQSMNHADLTFAVTAIQIKLNIMFAHIGTAKQMLDLFKKTYYDEDSDYLMDNMQSLRCQIALYENDDDTIAQWLKTAPNGNEPFFIRKTYSYITAAKAYMYRHEYMIAMSLLEQMLFYTEKFDRPFQRIEVLTLIAIVLYRVDRERWEPYLLRALKEAEEMKLVRVIAEKGGAVLPLLLEIRSQVEADGAIDGLWFSNLEAEAKRIAKVYPDYLKPPEVRRSDFSRQALEILSLQADGLSTGEIAMRLDMKQETVRYHIKQNYLKLGVSDKTNAILAARRIKLI